MPADDVTGLLLRWNDGDARDRLLQVAYVELKKIAARHMRRERGDHTLQPTALVHEAYEKLIDQSRVRWQNRAHSTRWRPASSGTTLKCICGRF